MWCPVFPAPFVEKPVLLPLRYFCSLSKISWLYLCECLSGILISFHRSICLFTNTTLFWLLKLLLLDFSSLKLWFSLSAFLSNFGSWSSSCDLSFLMNLRIVISFQFRHFVSCCEDQSDDFQDLYMSYWKWKSDVASTGCLCSKQPWKMEMVCPSGATIKFAYSSGRY